MISGSLRRSGCGWAGPTISRRSLDYLPSSASIVGPDELTHGAPRPLQVAVGVGR